MGKINWFGDKILSYLDITNLSATIYKSYYVIGKVMFLVMAETIHCFHVQVIILETVDVVFGKEELFIQNTY